jgi:hypothetical protein
MFSFSQPPNSLFKKDDVDSVQTLFWQRMEKHVEYATIQYFQVLYLRVLSGRSPQVGQVPVQEG